MSAYAKKSRFAELCSVCDRLCCETRDGISKGVHEDGIYCKYWQHSFATDLMFNLFEWKTHAESLEAERDALRERCEKLEWLVEVQDFVVYFDPTSTLDSACVELAASWKYAELQVARAATEVEP